MSKAFWVVALGWVIGVIVSAPAAFDGADGNGIVGMIPGMSPATSEFIITTLFAVVPPLLAATVIQWRRGKRR